MSYTCVSCLVSFDNATLQREHMKSEWHRYNLKRKVLEIAPISIEQFNQKLIDQAPVEPEKTESYCHVCKKAFKSEKTLASHYESKKHLEAAQNVTEPTVKSDSERKETNDAKDASFKRRLGMAKTEQEINDILDEKERNSKILELNECLFCSHESKSFEENMGHMTQAHSFYVPDVEKLTDLEGLISYLGHKISVLNICIYCNGKGKMLHSLEAARDHMVSKGHCKLPDFEEDEELYEFYNFGSEWEDLDEDGDAEDAEEEEEDFDPSEDNQEVYFTEGDAHLVLKNGTKIGNRQFLKYFKQNVKPKVIVPGSLQDPEMISRISNNYKLLGYTTPKDFHQVILRKKENDMKTKQSKKLLIKQNDLRARVGVKHNLLQHHYREQNPF